MLEKIIAAIIAATAIYFLYKSIKKKTSGKCDCGDCSENCTSCQNKIKK